MEKIRVSAKTLDEAITKAQIQLNTTYDKMQYDVIAQGSNGLFGIGAKPWIIEAYKKETEEFKDLTEEIKELSSFSASVAEPVVKPAENQTEESKAVTAKPEKKPEKMQTEKSRPTEKCERNEKKHEKREKHTEKRERTAGQENSHKQPVQEKEIPAPRVIKPVSEEDAKAAEENAKAFLQSVLGGMDMQVQAECSFRHDENELSVVLSGEDMGLLIGKRGQTLDSLQYLTSLVVNKHNKDEYIRIKLDTENYRARREATLRNLAKNIAYKVKRTRKTVSLEPMNPYERRIIHAALQNDKFVTTRSEGEEPFRHVVITLKK